MAAQTPLVGQSWRSTNASIAVPAGGGIPGQPVTVTLKVADTNLGPARITWEVMGQEPVFGDWSYAFVPPSQTNACRIEAEVQWPDGRRAFAANSISLSTSAPPQLTGGQFVAGVGFSFTVAGTPFAKYVIQASSDLSTWTPMVTNVLPASAAITITDPLAGSRSEHYYRAEPAP